MRLLIKKAQQLEREHQRDQAIQTLESAVRIDPGSVEARQQLADLYLLQVALDRAQEQFERLIELQPNYPGWYLPLFSIYEWRGMQKNALETLEALRQLQPKNLQATAHLCDSYTKNLLVEKAIATAGELFLLEGKPYSITAAKVESLLAIQPDHLDLLRMLGEIAQRNNELEGAQAIYERVILLDAQDNKSLRVLGEIYRQRGMKDKAVAVYERLAESLPNDLPTQVVLADLYRETEENEKAISMYDSLLLRQPGELAFIAHLASLWEKQGDLEQALLYSRQLQALNPQNLGIQGKIRQLEDALLMEHIFRIQERLQQEPANAEQRLSLSQALIQKGEIKQAAHELLILAQDDGWHSQAIALLESLKSRRPLEASVFYTLKDLYVDHRNLTGAIATMEEFINLNPTSPDAYLALALLLIDAKDLKRAMMLYRKAIQLGTRDHQQIIQGCQRIEQADPLDPEVYELAGMAWEMANDPRSAIANLEEALKLSPQRNDLRARLGKLHSEQGNFQQSIQHDEDFLLANPLNVEVRLRLADTLLRSGGLVKADLELQKITSLAPANTQLPDFRRRLDQALAYQELANLENELALDPDNWKVRLEIAGIHEKLGQSDRALEHLNRASAHPDAHAQASILLARIYHSKGDSIAAALNAKEALSFLDPQHEDRKELLYILGDSAQASGSNAEAVEAFQALYAIDPLYRDVSARLQRLSQPSQKLARTAAESAGASMVMPTQEGRKPCTHCGVLIRSQAKFCTKCGKTIA